jgi:signal transduction histidine kinase
MLNLLKSRLQAKLTFIQIVLVLIPVVIVALYAAGTLAETLTERQILGEFDEMDSNTQIVQNMLDRIQTDLLVLSRTSVMRRFANTLVEEPDAQAQADLEDLFASFLSSVDTPYKDFRILDSAGQEIVRVDHSGDEAVVVPAAELEDKSSRPYYTHTIGLSEGGVYNSGLDLNVDRGELTIPYLPVIRFATPLYAENGEAAGVLVIKAFAEPVLNSLVDEHGSSFVISGSGDYFSGVDPSKLYGSILETEVTFASDQPELSGLIGDQSSGMIDYANQLVFFQSINVGDSASLGFTVITVIPSDTILSGVTQAILVFTAITVVAVAVTALVAALISRNIAKPIRQLAVTAQAIGHGQWGVTVAAPRGSDEVAQLTNSFNGMSVELKDTYRNLENRTRQAEEATRMKDLFLATMSHELRTPLNSMIGFLHLMLFSGQMDEDNIHMAGRSLANTQRLLTLINNILDLSRIATGGLEIVPSEIALRSVASGLYNDLKLLAEDKGLHLELEIDETLPQTIHHDEARVSQIATNLVGNAIKFTEQGLVQLTFLRRGDKLLIQVQDTGVGIPQTKQHLIFDDFFQVDSTSTRKQQGAGLGLAIVRRLTLLMNGKISLVSEVGQGSTFTVELPLHLPQYEPDQRRKEAEHVFARSLNGAHADQFVQR